MLHLVIKGPSLPSTETGRQSLEAPWYAGISIDLKDRYSDLFQQQTAEIPFDAKRGMLLTQKSSKLNRRYEAKDW